MEPLYFSFPYRKQFYKLLLCHLQMLYNNVFFLRNYHLFVYILIVICVFLLYIIFILFSGRCEPLPPYPDAVPLGCEVCPNDWPLLVTDTLLSMHRGQRMPGSITVTTLTSEFIIKVCFLLHMRCKLYVFCFKAVTN